MQQYYTIITAEGQTLWAIATQEYGGVDGVYLLLADNLDTLRDLNDWLEPGTRLNIRKNILKSDVENFDIAQYFRENGISVNNNAE